MKDNITTIQELKDKINRFILDRDWQQFHNAKNVSMAIAAEAAELMEQFLWLDLKQADEAMKTKATAIEHEIADVLYMVLCLCNKYNIDVMTIIEQKMEHNAQKYPIEKSKGRAVKYTEL